MLYEMLSGRLPYPGDKKDNVLYKINNKPLIPKFFETYSLGGEPVFDFIQRCLTVKAKNRADVDELLAHRWIKALAPQNDDITNLESLQIARSLCSIDKRGTFQKGFINFLVGLKGQQADTDKFGKIFEKLDKDKTGYLSIDDIKAAVAEMQND